jgi:hypothetical protein
LGSSKQKESSTEGREVLIDARNEIAAGKAAFIIQAASDIRHGSSLFLPLGGPLELVEYNPTGAMQRYRGENARSFRATSSIPVDCLLAIRIANSRSLTYALTKLWFSYQMFSIAGIDLDPGHSPTLPKSPYPSDHVAYSQAIVLAYATIEELGLEVRASHENPSQIKGEWNPKVRSKLEGRLEKAGIDLGEPYAWNIRGSKTLLEHKRPAKSVSKTPWTTWDVRDAFVDVVDAIAHVSWLRSWVSAHKSKYEFLRVLSVYDVANAQYLARRLLLEKCGFWRNQPFGPTKRVKATRSS